MLGVVASGFAGPRKSRRGRGDLEMLRISEGADFLPRGAVRHTGRAEIVCGRVRPNLGVEGFNCGGHLEDFLFVGCDEIGWTGAWWW